MNDANTPTPLAVRPAATPGQITLIPPGPDDAGVSALVKYTDKGTIHSMKVTVGLNIKKGHVWQMPAGDRPHAISAVGYDWLNSIAGIALLTPPTLHIGDGRTVPNPYFERVAETDEIRRVYVRMVGIGRSSVGNQVAHDVTLCYDLGNYLAQDVWKKWAGYGDNTPKSWGRVFPFAHVPDEFKESQQHLCVAIPGGLVLYVDLSNKEALAAFGAHIQRQQFAERLAVTICRRNVLARFFAVRKVNPADDGLFYVTFVAWPETDKDLGRVAEMAAQAQEGRIVIDGEAVEVASTVIESDPGDTEADLAGELDEDQASAASEDEAPASVAPQAPPPEKAEQDKVNALRVEVRQLMVMLSPEHQQAACEAANVPGPKALGHIEDAAVLTALHAQLTQRGARPKNRQRTQASTKPNGPSKTGGDSDLPLGR